VKINEGENYESWAERVRMFEHGHAMTQIAQGKDMDRVMEEMARRIMDKLMHPIYKKMAQSEFTYDAEKAKQSYKEQFIDRVPRASDHIDDTLT
jgi:glutamyl-tRNA reductase